MSKFNMLKKNLSTIPIRAYRSAYGLGMACGIFFLSSCQQNSNDYALQKPRATDIAGVYYPDNKTLEKLRIEGRYPATNIEIKLEPNGVVKLQNIPDWWRHFGDSSGKFDNGYGTWSLITRESEWTTEKYRWVIDIDARWKGQESIAESARIDIRGQKPPYELQMIVGDPDQMSAMFFVKTAQPK